MIHNFKPSLAGWLLWGSLTVATAAPVRELIVTNDLVLERDAQLPLRLIVKASFVTIDGNGATLVGPGTIGEVKSLENAGPGILMEGVQGVSLKNVRVHGFGTGLSLKHVEAVNVTDCDFSDNFHNPAYGWGDQPARGGMVCLGVKHSVLRNNRANRVWDGLVLEDSDDNLVEDNDFSECSNTCAKLWHASRNRVLNNNLSYGIRIDRAKGEVHARDSTCVLIETGSNDNYWYRNNITHGGDGIFIRPLNRWVSTGNIFVENDTSYANNNCVESWSPGNTFIRNRANHGSYGFWLGGSDETVLIGNEAAFNGETNGYHNAAEPGFRHGGIVIVGGSGTHTRIEGNNLHDNNGGGLVLRGDVASRGKSWRLEHCVIQQNRLMNNRFGMWINYADNLVLAANTFDHNAEGNLVTNVSNFRELSGGTLESDRPEAVLWGPEIATVGEPARFDASSSPVAPGETLHFHWSVDGHDAGTKAYHEQVFTTPGFYRVELLVDNGALAALAWRSLLVTAPVAKELGTEGEASRWGFELENNQDGRGKMQFVDDDSSMIGKHSLRFTPNPYPGFYATAIFPATRDAKWDFTGKKEIRFWIKTQNPNVTGWQNAGPVVRLLGPSGQMEFKPVKDGNLLNEPPFSEARWLWLPVTIPLSGNTQWVVSITGSVSLDRIDAFSLSLDSWGGDPFNVWLDGLCVE